MTGDSCNSASKKISLALSDMTNVPSKRGISSILGDLLLKKSGDDSGKTVAREGSGVKFSKRLCLVVDDMIKESTKTSDTNEGSSDDDDDDEKNSFDDSAISDFVVVKESQGETNAVGDIGVEPLDCDPLKKTSEKDSDMNVFASQTDPVSGEDLNMTVFSSSNSESDESLAMVEAKSSGGTGFVLPNSQTIKSFGMIRCSNVDGMGADDELKSCSCSFCLKAAYIWSDLQYQDIKGRLSALKKSQKEASNLIQRNGQRKPTDIYGSENFINGEFDLRDQWTSLFLNMESILARESNHLQNSYLAMKEVRENYKINLDRAMKTPQQQQQQNNT